MIDSTLPMAFELVSELVREFQTNPGRYKSPDYQEAEVRKDFIDKFLIAFGWDVNHDRQKNPYEQEVKVERKPDHDKDYCSSRCGLLDREIDACVGELYGIHDEERILIGERTGSITTSTATATSPSLKLTQTASFLYAIIDVTVDPQSMAFVAIANGRNRRQPPPRTFDTS